MSERDRLRSLQAFFPQVAQAETQNPYAGASAALQKKIFADQPFTSEELANSIRDPMPQYPGAAIGIGRIDPNHPVARELLKNLPPDIEYLPDHPAGPMLRLRQNATDVPMS